MYISPISGESHVSVNLSWHCNLRCDFCIVPPDRLLDRTRISLETLKTRLDEIHLIHPIRHLEIFGGEASILPVGYLREAVDLLKTYRPKALGVVTNLTHINPVFEDSDLYLAVSYDGVVREHHDKTLRNMQQMTRPFTAMVLVTPGLLSIPIERFINEFNSCPMLEAVKVIPYFSNESNDHQVSDLTFEAFVWEFIEKAVHLNARLENLPVLEETLTQEHYTVNDRIYVTPSGELAVAEKDSDGRDHLLGLKDYGEYLLWVSQPEKWRVTNPTCQTCEFVTRCGQAHLYPKHRDLRSCPGHRNLLRKYRDTFL